MISVILDKCETRSDKSAASESKFNTIIRCSCKTQPCDIAI